MYQHTQQHNDNAQILANSAEAAVIDLSLSSSEDEDANSDSDNSIDIVRKDPPRPLISVPSRVNNTMASTSQQFRHPATILPRPQLNNSSKQYYQPQLNQAAFASTSAAFKTSAKSRAMLNMTTEHARLGLPISVPKVGSSTSTSSIHAFKSPPAPSTFTTQQERRRDWDEMGLNDFTSPADGEKALRELVESTMDMENVDLSAAMPDNMNCTLLPHQILGVHWLKDREKGKRGGGILADDMGLGKTIQMIALMCANRPTSKPRGTLVVCPVSLMEQWKDEIKNKTDDSLRVYIHHGPNRAKDSVKLERYDVVITSYPTAVSEWIDPKPAREKTQKDISIAPKKVVKEKELGPLFEAAFHRIILDEAHGRSTKMHKACCDLTSDYKWCLTGTPIQNDILDLHALFEFLGTIVKPMNELAKFKETICQPIKAGRAKVAMSRLTVILKAVLLRRTKMTLIDGKPLIALPKREIFMVTSVFLDADERAFYEAVEKKMQLTLNTFLKAGTLNNNYTSVLILLLRMRQACSHPTLVAGKTADDAEALDPTPQKESSFSTASSATATPRINSTSDDLDSLIGTLSALNVQSDGSSKVCALCPKKVRKEDDSYCVTCEGEMSQFGALELSTKIRQAIHILEDIRKEAGNKKTIVFSQFTSMFDLLQPFLVKAGFKFVRFDGKMNKVQKSAALEMIRHNPAFTVILISIKSGSVGLNLTACSRVILMDIWWNPAIENQAFDRAHRFGQKDDVKIYKITIANTIEDRLLELQSKKSELATAALDGGDLKANKLTTADIMYLFRGDGEGMRNIQASRSK